MKIKGLISLFLIIVISASLLCSCAKDKENENDTTVPETKAETETEAETEDIYTLAPDAAFYDLDGNKVQLSDFYGKKPIIMNFWASWCAPCRSEMPTFEEAFKEYGDEVQFLMINLTDGETETVDIANNYVKSQNFTFPVYFDSDIDCVKTYEITSIPVTYFIDETGHLLAYAKGSLSAETLTQGIDLAINGK